MTSEGGRFVYQVRDILNMTQEGFAQYMGLTAGTVSRWERGKTVPALTVRQFLLLVDALSKHGYTVNDLPKLTQPDPVQPKPR